MIFQVRHVRETCVKFISSRSAGIQFYVRRSRHVSRTRRCCSLSFFFLLLHRETLYAGLHGSVCCEEILFSLPETTVVILRLTTKLETELTRPRWFLFRTFSFQVNGHFGRKRCGTRLTN